MDKTNLIDKLADYLWSHHLKHVEDEYGPISYEIAEALINDGWVTETPGVKDGRCVIELESFGKDFQERMKDIWENCRLWTKLRLLMEFGAPESDIREVLDECQRLNNKEK
jgi:hypothetical protein